MRSVPRGLERLFQSRRVGVGDESEAVAACALRGRCAAACDHDARSPFSHRRGRHVDPPSIDLDGVACEQAQQQFQTLVGDLSTAARVDTHVLVFLWAVADPNT
jgi:hypothetical protein